MLSQPFLKRICEADVAPCLNFEFKPRPYVKKVASAMLRNTCSIEKLKEPLGHHSGEPSPASERNQTRLTSQTPSILSSDESIIVDLDMVGVDYCCNNATAAMASVSISEASSPIKPGDRLRGLMSHFTTSVSSLPETLLASQSNGVTSWSANNEIAPSGSKYCSLCGSSTGPLKYRFRINDKDSWNFIDNLCRKRLVAAGHFFTFLRHLRSGLHSNRPILDLYYDSLHYRRMMFYARLDPAATAFFIQSDLEAYLDLFEAQQPPSTTEAMQPSKEHEASINLDLPESGLNDGDKPIDVEKV